MSNKEKMYTIYSNLERIVTITKAKEETGGKTWIAVKFVPGENFVSEKELKIIKDVPMFKELISLGRKGLEAPEDLGEVVTIGNPEDKGFTVETLRTLNHQTLVATIKGKDGKEGVLDLELLYRLREKEHRKTVLEAIDEQLEVLKVKK